VKLPTVVPTPSPAGHHSWLKAHVPMTPSGSLRPCCEFVKETGDVEFFDMSSRWQTGRATVYEHMKRAPRFLAEQSDRTGICKGLRADWNDCLNLGRWWKAPGLVPPLLGADGVIEAGRFLKGTRTSAGTRHGCRRAIGVRDAPLVENGYQGLTRKGIRIDRGQQRRKDFLESTASFPYPDSPPPSAGNPAWTRLYRTSLTLWHPLVWPCFTKPDETSDTSPGCIRHQGERCNLQSSQPWAWSQNASWGEGTGKWNSTTRSSPANQNDMIEIREAEPYSYVQSSWEKTIARMGEPGIRG